MRTKIFETCFLELTYRLLKYCWFLEFLIFWVLKFGALIIKGLMLSLKVEVMFQAFSNTIYRFSEDLYGNIPLNLVTRSKTIKLMKWKWNCNFIEWIDTFKEISPWIRFFKILFLCWSFYGLYFNHHITHITYLMNSNWQL